MNKVSIRRLVAGVAVAGGLAAGALAGVGPFATQSASNPARPAGSPPASEQSAVSTVASARGASLAVFEQEDGRVVTHRLANPRATGAPLVLLVVDKRPGWLKVQVPERPNGSTGWVRAGDVTTDDHRFRIEVSLSEHRLSAFDGDERILETSAAVGKASTPTPTGHFYTTELLRPPNPRGTYGPYAIGLSAHSDVLTDFAGGDGTVGIHGTNEPAALGTDASNGCVRIDNDAITLLAETLPAGTPIDIVA